MNIYATFHERVTAILSAIVAEGRLPADSRSHAFRGRTARATRPMAISRSMRAMVYAKEAKASFANPRQLAVEIAATLAGDAGVDQAEVAGPGFINVRVTQDVHAVLLRAALTDPVGFARGVASAGRRADQRGICLRQPDRANACRPWPWCRVRRCAGEPPDVFRAGRS